MNRLQHLLLKLGEEGSEIAQIASKNIQFGLHQRHQGLSEDNKERCHCEIDDLLAMVEMLNDEFDFGFVSSRARIDAKKVKVEKYYNKSKMLGMVDK